MLLFFIFKAFLGFLKELLPDLSAISDQKCVYWIDLEVILHVKNYFDSKDYLEIMLNNLKEVFDFSS